MHNINNKKCIAIVPARSGSKSVIDKNIASLAGYPLLAYSIIAAHLSKKIERIIVSTDSSDYAALSKLYGAEVPFLRPPELSLDTSTDKEFFLHAMQWMHENEGEVPEYWVHLRPTAPLRNPKIIDEAVEVIMKDSSATSLRSAHKAPESPLKWFRKKGKYFTGLAEAAVSDEYLNLPKEAFADVYVPVGYVDVVRASHVLNQDTLLGANMLAFNSPVCTEVDSPEEFDFIDYQINRYGSVLLDYLSSKYPLE